MRPPCHIAESSTSANQARPRTVGMAATYETAGHITTVAANLEQSGRSLEGSRSAARARLPSRTALSSRYRAGGLYRRPFGRRRRRRSVLLPGFASTVVGACLSESRPRAGRVVARLGLIVTSVLATLAVYGSFDVAGTVGVAALVYGITTFVPNPHTGGSTARKNQVSWGVCVDRAANPGQCDEAP